MVYTVEVCIWNPSGLVSKNYTNLPKEDYLSMYEEILDTFINTGYSLDFIYDLEDAMSKKDYEHSYPLCVGKNDELTINISLLYDPHY